LVDSNSGSGTIEIPLTRGYFALIDLQDYELISKYSWHVDVRKNGLCYASTSLYDKNTKRRSELRMHCLLMPNVEEVDHENRNGLDNRRKNLRPASREENMYNTKIQKNNRTSQYKGITFVKRLTSRPWQLRIRSKHVGYFATEQEAASKYDELAVKEYGKFAYLNGVKVDKISNNHRRQIIAKHYTDLPKQKNGRYGKILTCTLSCGHTFTTSASGRYKLEKQKESTCKVCKAMDI